jgi:hypothetical protein
VPPASPPRASDRNPGNAIEAANAWLPDFIASHNARFGREPANAKDLHRKLTVTDDLDEILAWREKTTVMQNLTLHYDRMMLILEPTPLAPHLTAAIAEYREPRPSTTVVTSA